MLYFFFMDAKTYFAGLKRPAAMSFSDNRMILSISVADFKFWYELVSSKTALTLPSCAIITGPHLSLTKVIA